MCEESEVIVCEEDVCVSPDVLFMVGVFRAYERCMDVISAQRLRHRDLLHTLLIFKIPPAQNTMQINYNTYYT